MLSTEGGRYEGTATSAYSPNIVRPGKRAPGGRRAALKIALCVLLPPIGLLYIWRTRSFPLRGRMLATAMAFVSMALLFLPTIPKPQLNRVLPNPVAPAGATRAPASDAVTALSNIEQLLIAQEAAEAARLQEGQEAPTEDPALAAQREAENEAILNTTVYSVNKGAKLYHTGPTCGNQINRKQLTVQQAIANGLGACKDCKPPTPK
ncbi:MAG: hypothetical protein GX592_06125 [Clostridiales bacterium]|nr:hypothetical protein [Clostridiales bacterium]